MDFSYLTSRSRRTARWPDEIPMEQLRTDGAITILWNGFDDTTLSSVPKLRKARYVQAQCRVEFEDGTEVASRHPRILECYIEPEK